MRLSGAAQGLLCMCIFAEFAHQLEGRRSNSVMYYRILCYQMSLLLYFTGQVLWFTKDSSLLRPYSIMSANLREQELP